jgi:hypothetical protein
MTALALFAASTRRAPVMPFIPRQVKPPARVPLTCKVPEATATLLKLYAAFLDSTQEYVVDTTLGLAFRRDKEFHAWLATTHPEIQIVERDSPTRPADPSRPTPAIAALRAHTPALPESRGERARS